MSSPVWFVNLISKTFSQIPTLAKLTHLPGVGRLIEYALFENDDIMHQSDFVNHSIARISQAVDLH